MRNPFTRLVRNLAIAALLLATSAVLADESKSTEQARAVGPDVTVFTLSDTSNYGASGGTRGYSVGTVSCNVGDAPLNWCDQTSGCAAGATTHDHPVIAQNMYRLKDGRFMQIGASWLKHGFLSTNSTSAACAGANGQSCSTPPAGSNQLGVGCTDPYGAGLNGSRPLGPKSQVNATNGAYPFPFSPGTEAVVWNQRIAVAESDLAAASNPGALYYVEGHYVAPDDAVAGNGLNNASYRKVTINAANSNLVLDNVVGTVRQKSAIEVWPLVDPTVELLNVDVPGPPVERFHVARKVTEVTPGVLWRYEYAVHNMNSDRAASRLTIRFLATTQFSGIGFHDVDAHSGEPYDTADWLPATTTTNTIEWQAPAFPASPQNANAIRWGTMYNFWFEATRPPSDIALHTLGLLKTGTPTEVDFLEGNDTLFENGFE